MNPTVQEEGKSQLGLFKASTYTIKISYKMKNKTKYAWDRQQRNMKEKTNVTRVCLHVKAWER